MNSKARGRNKDFFQKIKASDKIALNRVKCESNKQMRVISKLETSTRDAPLVHIIQELKNNCFISEVKVNTNQTNSSLLYRKKRKVENHNELNYYPFQKNPEPTAPTLDLLLKSKTQKEAKNNRVFPLVDESVQNIECKSSRHKLGGFLLKKRLSHSDFNFKPRNQVNPPPKPPRTSFCSETKSWGSSASTTSSVKEAEKVVDEFIAKSEFRTTSILSKVDTKFSEKSNFHNNHQRYKRKTYPLCKFFCVQMEIYELL